MTAAGSTTSTVVSGASPLPLHRRPAMVKAQLGRYLEVVKWAVIDSMWRVRYSTAITIGCGLGGMSLQVSALGLALHYAKLLEHGKPYVLLGHKFLPQTSWKLLVGFAGLILIGLISSTTLVLISRLKGLRLRRRYE